MIVYQVLDVSALTSKDVSPWLSDCSADRRDAISRFINEKDRIRSICGDHLIRNMVSELTGDALNKIDIRRSETGKPYLNGNPWYCSISHSGNYVACTVSDFPIGVDIETIRSVSPKLINRACSSEECAYINGSINKDVAFFKLWTTKEAFLKMTGEGIHYDLRDLNCVKCGCISVPHHHRQIVTESYVLSFVYQ